MVPRVLLLLLIVLVPKIEAVSSPLRLTVASSVEYESLVASFSHNEDLFWSTPCDVQEAGTLLSFVRLNAFSTITGYVFRHTRRDRIESLLCRRAEYIECRERHCYHCGKYHLCTF